eukprot:g32781.t1
MPLSCLSQILHMSPECTKRKVTKVLDPKCLCRFFSCASLPWKFEQKSSGAMSKDQTHGFTEMGDKAGEFCGYSVDYAKSSKAACRGCKQKIHKGMLRIGTDFYGEGDFTVNNWRHYKCHGAGHFSLLQDEKEIKGYDALTEEDKQFMEKFFKGEEAEREEEEVPEPPPPPSEKPKRISKKKKLSSDEDEDDEDDERPKKKSKKAAPKKKKSPFCLPNCTKGENGNMIGCDGKDCTEGEGWFHYSCVKITAKEAKGLDSWLCPTCTKNNNEAVKKVDEQPEEADEEGGEKEEGGDKEGDDEAGDEGEEEEDEEPKKKKPAAKKAKEEEEGAKEARPERPRLKTITQEQLDELQALKVPDLKAKLKAHAQIVGGSKQELVDRIVSCMEFGCLPKCPECGGGRMKEAGDVFKCPGYMEDDEFQHCGFTCDHTKLTFAEWDPNRV